MATETKKKTTKKTVATKKAPAKSVKTTEKTVNKKASVEKKVKTSEKKVDSNKFAVIELGGQQLKVQEGYSYTVIKIEGNKGDKINNEKVLLIANDKDVKVGKPYVEGGKVVMEIETQKKDKKVNAFKYKAKARYRKKYGYRELITRVKVLEIVG